MWLNVTEEINFKFYLILFICFLKNLKTPLFLIFLKDFFMVHFLKSLLNVLQYCFGFMFWFFSHEACRILAPCPGIELPSPALGGEVLTTGPPGKSHKFYLLLIYLSLNSHMWLVASNWVKTCYFI